MKIKSSELTGTHLDWAVAKCEGAENCWGKSSLKPYEMYRGVSYSTDWSQGGPIMQREGIEIQKGNPLYFPKGNERGDYYEPLWVAGKMHGPTILIAAMRYLVASKLGDEVEIPEALL